MHSSEIAKTRFEATKFREGYAMADVDALMEKARTTLQNWEAGRAGELTAKAVVDARISSTKFREGYVQDQVDDFLDLLAATLNSYETGQRP